ncbi:LlaJI family restriction endonuclease [Clostridiaceae bacterium M8S5]|nr:LlaJI family restriction endonuclease [Clostridiaceae bacterium M8S5]
MIYITELKEYNEQILVDKLCLDSNMIQKLLDKKILYLLKNGLYHFKFVGVLIIKEKVIFSLPKYHKNKDKKALAKQILVLFKEYSGRENLNSEEIDSFGDLALINNYNMLSTIVFMINDYFENGLYSNEKSIYKLNGEEEINWSRTIDYINPIIIENNPVYLEFYTNAIKNDDTNYFRRLHMYILNECTKKLDELGLLEFLGLEPIRFDISNYTPETPQSIIYRINKELNIQYINRKQLLLKAMASFISKEKMILDNLQISFYGTRSFHVVWEKTCGYVLNNKYETLKHLIDCPKWTSLNGKVHKAATLVPDIISVSNDYFVILDAKYYLINLNDEILYGNPGVEDVTKQYMYQLAFNNYIKMKKFKQVKNLFVFPSEENHVKEIGIVTLEFLEKLGLEDIILYLIPASMIFDYYIHNKKIDIIELFK